MSLLVARGDFEALAAIADFAEERVIKHVRTSSFAEIDPNRE
jgi:hypothetical protein